MSLPAPLCTGCSQTPDQIREYVECAEAEGLTAAAYVRREEEEVMSTKEPAASPRILQAVFDIKSMKPACVLLQAIYGGDSSVCHEFEDWELAPTKTMKMLKGTRVEWQELAKRAARKAGKKDRRKS